jgi:DNA-binding MarR family transcriptional regulator
METQYEFKIELSRQVSDILSQLAGEIVRASAADMLRLLQREEMSMPRAVALMFLERQQTASISDISNYLNLSLGNTSHLVDQLVCGGYVTRTEHPDDRRLKLIMLTAKGLGFVQEIKQVRITDMAQRLEHLPAPLLETAFATMSAVLEHLQVDK